MTVTSPAPAGTAAPPAPAPARAPARGPRSRRLPGRGWLAVATVLVWVLLWALLRGRDTLFLSPAELTPLHRRINDVSDAIGAGRNSNPLFVYGVNELRLVIDAVVSFMQDLIARPAGGRPVPQIGWLGVVATAGLLAWAIGNARVALLAVGGLLLLGLQGLWVESMDTLALTLAAVALCLLIGIPLGLWAGLSNRVYRLTMPVLDFLQTMPSFVYLAPLTLFFLIGPASAVIATVLYAVPPVVRLTAHGVRGVPESVLEATTSLGSTGAQTLRKVLLPMSKRTIVLGINQTIMAALSMVTIAALIDAPGLGKTVIKALETLDVGVAFNAGLAIVVLAIVLDRITTAASERAELTSRRHAGRASRSRRPALLAGAALALGAIGVSRTYLWAATFPTSFNAGGRGTDIGIGSAIARAADSTTGWVQDNLSGLTNGFRDLVTVRLLNPFESLLTGSPWWLVVAVLVTLAALAGGRTAAVTTALGLALLVGTGLWFDAMTTLASTVLATLVVLALGVVVGVWMGRSNRVDRAIRPVLDAGQTMPAFVYLVPFLALFAASRFTAIMAAIVYAAPVAIKIVADGIRAVSVSTVEAATALGSTTWQIITKVQLPMARRSLTLAANQGVVYVLSMVVVGGLVGAGALGYDVVAGFSQGQLYGKGLAAGLAIVLLGTMLDRVTQAAARRSGPASQHH
ncbi:MAG: ABC transporter permease subunit [Frankiales bacterium]|nr:ABC transporter permease subunit [Frankiales bacterium]